jgi:ferritin-like metal-binding protein YciE
MAEAGTLHDAFIDELRDTYDAEKQLTKALPKLAKAATNPKLRQAFESHLEETQGQIARLEQVFESLDEKVRGKHCDGIAGIIDEGKSIMEEDFDETTMDACLIAAGQRAEHYEMAAYGTLVAWAQAMGTARPPSSCSRRSMKRRLLTRSCPAWPKAASIRVRLNRHRPKRTRNRWPPPATPGRLWRRPVIGTLRAAEGAMVLIQLLLPTTARQAARPWRSLPTRQELADQFNGLTAYLRSPAKGWWTAPDGHTEQDDVVMVEVVTNTFDRAWWRTYAATLAARFGQESIHLRAVPVDMLDEGDQ